METSRQKIIKIGAILETPTSRKDRSIKLVFEANEIGDEQAAAAFSMRQQFGWLLFSPDSIDDRAIPDEPAPSFEDDRPPRENQRTAHANRGLNPQPGGCTFPEERSMSVEMLCQLPGGSNAVVPATSNR